MEFGLFLEDSSLLCVLTWNEIQPLFSIVEFHPLELEGADTLVGFRGVTRQADYLASVCKPLFSLYFTLLHFGSICQARNSIDPPNRFPAILAGFKAWDR
jgi:hypothetical protein